MTHDEFISIVRKPQTVKTDQLADLKEMVERYPYLVSARLFYAKALKLSNSIHFAANVNNASVYCTDRRWFYYYIYPEKIISNERARYERVSKSSGNYFDMINSIESEGVDTKQSLRILAEKLKEARSMVIKPQIEGNKMQTIDSSKMKMHEISEENTLNKSEIVNECTEDNAKKLISEHKYKEAIEILRSLDLNNPKKSVYFADQIRFLEKVISNTKK